MAHLFKAVAVLLLLVNGAYWTHAWETFPDPVPVKLEAGGEPLATPGRSALIGALAAGLLALTGLACLFRGRAITLFAVVVNVAALGAFHLVAQQVAPDPLFRVPPRAGLYGLAGVVGVGLVAVAVLAFRRSAPPPAEPGPPPAPEEKP